MRLSPIGLLAVALLVGHVGAEPAAQAGKAVKLEKAGLLQEITNSQKRVMVPPTGQAFLWIMTTASQVQTIDLTKVSVMSGATSSSLFGVDGTHDGDPTRFAMIAPAQLRAALYAAGGILVGRLRFTPARPPRPRSSSRRSPSVRCSSVPRVSDWTGEGAGTET